MMISSLQKSQSGKKGRPSSSTVRCFGRLFRCVACAVTVFALLNIFFALFAMGLVQLPGLELEEESVKRNLARVMEERKKKCRTKQLENANSGSTASAMFLQTKQHAVIVPYRDRSYHLTEFIDYMSAFFKRNFPEDDFSLWIIEQDDNELFNRGFLTNVGLSHIDNHTECVILHDVDVVPGYFTTVPYNNCTRPTQLSSEPQHHEFRAPYAEFSGAVFGMHLDHWKAINGMSNAFRGWGGEDDELYRRLMFKGLLDCDRSPPQPFRPPKGKGVFLTISEDEKHHTRGKRDENISSSRFKMMGEYDYFGVDRTEIDGWRFTKFNLTDHRVLLWNESDGFTSIHHIKAVPDYRRSLLRNRLAYMGSTAVAKNSDGIEEKLVGPVVKQ